MRILFLHLSDAHFRSDTKYSYIDINAMTNALKQMNGFDECILVFSGDIAYSGEEDQYQRASGFISRLITKIKSDYLKGKIIHTLIVPGNHDNLANNPKRGIEELKGYYSSEKNINEKFYEDLKQLDNFYLFADKNYCFRKGKVVDVRKIQFGKFVIKVNLINSAPLSLLCDGNEDKGLHYMPQREIDKLSFDKKENYTVSVMHHSPEWFSDESKQALYKKLHETSDLIFIGHEHFSISENKVFKSRYKEFI